MLLNNYLFLVQMLSLIATVFKYAPIEEKNRKQKNELP